MKKNTLIIGMAVIATALLSACSAIESKKISKAEDLKSIMEEVKENFSDTQIISLDFTADDHLSDKFSYLLVHYYKDGGEYTQSYHKSSGWGDPDKSNFTAIRNDNDKANKLKKLEDFDFSKVETLIADAVKWIEENTDEFEDFTLYTIKQGANAKGEIVTGFTLEATKKGEGTTREGRNIVTNYYDFDFEADASGKVTYQD